MFTCERRCSKKRSCGRHKCGEMCCVVGHLWTNSYWKRQQFQQIHSSFFVFKSGHGTQMHNYLRLQAQLWSSPVSGGVSPWKLPTLLANQWVFKTPFTTSVLLFTYAQSITRFLHLRPDVIACYFGNKRRQQLYLPILSRFWWAGLLLWRNCHVPTYSLWHQTTRVQKPLHTAAWLWSPRYPLLLLTAAQCWKYVSEFIVEGLLIQYLQLIH